MKYRRPEFILDPPDAEMLELPNVKTCHVDEADMLLAAIHLAGSTLAERTIEDFEAIRQDCEDIDDVFEVFDGVDTQVRSLLTMNIMVSCMVDRAVRQ